MRSRNLQIQETLLRLDECNVLVLGDSTERFDEGIRSHDHGQDRAEDTDRSGQEAQVDAGQHRSHR